MKKILYVVPVLVLLAAGCNSAPTNNNSQTGQSNTPTSSETMASSSMPSAKNEPVVGANSTWQATLQASNNAAKGQYMITSGGHIIYLKTSRNYTALIGKPVNVSYTGNLDSFTLGNITAQ